MLDAMPDPLTWFLAFLAGLGLGGVFFGGLWWTVRRGLSRQGHSSARPALLFVASLWLRTSFVLLGFFLVSGGVWQRLLACLLGFVVARPVVVRLTRPAADPPRGRRADEVSHAP